MINLPKSSQQLCDDLFERLAFASECEKKGQKVLEKCALLMTRRIISGKISFALTLFIAVGNKTLMFHNGKQTVDEI